MGNIWNKILNFCLTFGGRLLLAVLVLVVGSVLIKIIIKLMKKRKNTKYDDPTVHQFLMNFIKIALYVLLIVTIIAILGVPMASVVAVIASAGVAIGLALQGSLSNFAGGIMLLIFRPFKLDDFIEASGYSGTVVDIGIFYTTLRTTDNKAVTLPNGALMNDNVINYTVHDTRRLDLTFSAAYGSDVEHIKTLLLEEAQNHELVLKEPAPFCRMAKQGDSSLDFVLRVWVKRDDYWTVNFDLLESITARMEAEGIHVPYNQLDVNLKHE